MSAKNSKQTAVQIEEAANNENGRAHSNGLYEKKFSVARRDGWDGKAVTGTVMIDFTNVPHEQLLEWASRTLIIVLQASIRRMSHAEATSLLQQPLVKKAAEIGIGIAAPEKQLNKAKAILASLPEDVRMALFQEMSDAQ